MSIWWGGHTAEEQAQIQAAHALVGKLVRFNHEPAGVADCRVLRAVDGMVELDGWSGRFAPHLLVVVVDVAVGQ